MTTPRQLIEEAAEKAASEECRRIYPDLCTGLSDDHVLFLRYRDELKPAFLRFASQLHSSGALKGVEIALEESVAWMQELHDDGDSAGWALEKHGELAQANRTALATLSELKKAGEGNQIGSESRKEPK